MARKPDAPSNKKPADKLAPFGEMVEAALSKFTQADWIGNESPLAQPYLLHKYMLSEDDHPRDAAPLVAASLLRDFRVSESSPASARGHAVRRLLREAFKSIRGHDSDLYKAIIEAHYFQGQSPVEAGALPQINLGRAQFYEQRRRAVRAFENVLLALLQPALRPEATPQPPQRMLGRDAGLAACLALLKAGQSVQIVGGGGIGKTALASRIAQAWLPDRVFWHTFRPGSKDQFSTLLHALAYFLHRCYESTPWITLLAQSKSIESGRAFELLRDALESLRQHGPLPLFCFDETDMLPNPTQPNNDEYRQIMNLLAKLHGLAPLLIVGQHVLLEGPAVCRLEGLSPDEVAQMLQMRGMSMTRDKDRQRLQQYTQGNPRLLMLLIGLQARNEATGDALADAFAGSIEELSHAPSMEALLNRLLSQLVPTEQDVLNECAVYPDWAPGEVWRRSPTTDAALKRLVERGLVQTDAQDNVAVLPAYRQIIYEQLALTPRQALHTQAARVWAERGTYTAAAYHQIEAGNLAHALLDWQQHKQLEINQGQAGTALHLFRAALMDAQQLAALSHEGQQMLSLLCAELSYLRGDLAQAKADLGAVPKTEQILDILDIRADLQAGVIENEAGEFDDAQTRFRHALEVAESKLGASLAHIHKGLGWRHWNLAEMEDALHEGQLARYEADNFLGLVYEYQFDYIQAEKSYLSALVLAEEIGHKDGIAKTCINLAGVYGRQGRSEAYAFQQRGESFYRQIGKWMYLSIARMNSAFLYILEEKYAEALHALDDAVDHFRRYALEIPKSHLATIEQSLAEAELGLGHLDKAEQHAARAMKFAGTWVMPDSLRTRGEIYLERGLLDEAEQDIRSSLASIGEDRYMEAFSWRALALVQRARDARGPAAESKSHAIEIFEQIGLLNEVNRTMRLLPTT